LAGLPAAPAWAAGGGLITINASLIIQLVNFLILLVVLYRFLYRPLMTTLADRATAISQQLAEAQAAREEAHRQLADFETRLRASQAEAQQAREQVLREAAAMRERLTAEARAEAGRLIETAQTQIAQEVRRARSELRQEVGGLAVQIAERLIRRSLREEDQQRLVQEALAALDARPAS
jgi:F-type H+-transporting ATPase subunit b